MSNLAKKVAKTTPILDNIPDRLRRTGPSNLCFELYGRGDLEDWLAVESLRASLDENGRKRDWRSVQAVVDEIAGVKRPIGLERFRRHWRRRCGCWPEDLRL